jgi:hypothetical protein|tara:strand:+ start:825 stop:1367 length:543 start_codon:yes stop_codon:yes gene_type:complete
MKKFNRNPIKVKKLYFKNKKKIISIAPKFFFNKYKIHEIIQILPSDFKLIKKMRIFTHFNIQDSVHKPGKKYLLIKIHKRGSFDGKIYKQAILENNNFILTECTFSKNNIKYSDLNKYVFKYSLSNIKSIKDLKKAIKRRYKKSLIHLSNKEKLSLGIAITKLKIIKIFKLGLLKNKMVK